MAEAYELSDFSAVTKEILKPEVIKKMVLAKQVFFKEIRTNNVMNSRNFSFGENKYVFTAEIGYATDVWSTKEGSHLGPFTKGRDVQMTAYLVKLTTRAKISYHAQKIGADRRAMIENALDKIKNSVVRGYQDQMQGYLWGNPDSLIDDSTNGSMPALATIQTGGSGTGPYTLKYHFGDTAVSMYPGARFLRVGQYVRVGTAAEIVADTADETTVAAVAEDWKTVTFDDSVTVAADDLIVPGDANGYADDCLPGLWYHVNNGTGDVANYQGKSRTTYPELNAQVKINSGTLRDLSTTIWQQAVDSVIERNVGGKINKIYCRPSMRRAWIELFADQVRFGASEAMANQTKAKMDGLTPTEDPDCQPGLIWALDTTQFELPYADLFTFDEPTKGSILYEPDEYDNSEVRNHALLTLICFNPAAQVKLGDLKDDK